MEVAFGVVGAAAFGLQLAGTVKKAAKLLRDVKEAPSDLTRLRDDIDQLFDHLSEACSLIEQQEALATPTSAISLVDRAIRRCESTVNVLGVATEKLETRFKGGHNKWGALKMVFKKDELLDLGRRIHENQASLQTAMMMNLSRLQYLSRPELDVYVLTLDFRLYNISITAQIQKNEATNDIPSQTSETMLVADTSMDSNICDRQQRKSMARTQRRRHFSYHGFWWGYAVQESKTSMLCLSDAREEIITSEETSIKVAPFFMRWVFEFQTNQCAAGVTRILRYYYTLPSEHEIFEVCQTGTLTELRAKLSAGKISPYVVDEFGQSLLHFAAWKCFGMKLQEGLETLKFLTEAGVDKQLTDNMGTKALEMLLPRMDSHDPDDSEQNWISCFRLLTGDVSEATTDDFAKIYRNIYYMGVQGWMLADSIASFTMTILSENEADILSLHCLERWLRHFYTLSDSDFLPDFFDTLGRIWGARAFRYYLSLLRMGTHDQKRKTLLDMLFLDYLSPMETHAMAQNWLNCIRCLGFDSAEYLYLEAQRYTRPYYKLQSLYIPNPFGAELSRRIIFSFDNGPAVRWEWWIDPEATDYILRREYEHMMILPEASDNLPLLRYGRRQIPIWKISWPFNCPAWTEYYQKLHEWHDWGAWYDLKDWYQEAERSANARANRREEKRRIKRMKADGTYKLSKIPGSWIE